MVASSTLSTILGVIASGVTLASFVFAIWVWMRTDARIKTATQSLQAIQGIIDNVVVNDDGSKTLEERIASWRGAAMGVREVTTAALESFPTGLQAETRALRAKKQIWGSPDLLGLEASADIATVWVLTPDFHPDVSTPDAGRVVRENLKRGVHYVYFVPPAVADDQELTSRLFAQISNHKNRGRNANIPKIVPFLRTELLSGGANCVLYFEGAPAAGTGVGYHELLLPGVTQRNMFWRELDKSERDGLIRVLQASLQERQETSR